MLRRLTATDRFAETSGCPHMNFGFLFVSPLTVFGVMFGTFFAPFIVST